MRFVKSARDSFKIHVGIFWVGACEILNLQRKTFNVDFLLSTDGSTVHIFSSLSSKSIFILTRDFRHSGMIYCLQSPDSCRSLDTLFYHTKNIFAFLKTVEISLKTQSRCKTEAGMPACINKQHDILASRSEH